MIREREKGIVYSASLHLFVFLLLVFGLPTFLTPTPPPEPAGITVELLPVTGITNIKPSEQPPAEKEKPEEKPEKEKPKPSPPVKTNEQTPPPPPPEKLTPKPKDKPEEKKPEPKKEEKKKATLEDLDAVLKAVQETAQKEKKDDKKEVKDTSKSTSKSRSTQYNPSMPLSMSEEDAIRSQISTCWSVPAGAKDAHALAVLLHIELHSDGTVMKVELANASKSRYSSDAFFRAAADSAMRAVRLCSPLKNLPPEKYDTWRDMELNFDPKDMLF